MTRAVRLRGCVGLGALCVAVCLVGCGSSGSGESPVESTPSHAITEDQVPWVSNWSAENGIELQDRSGELIRAVTEASTLALRVGLQSASQVFLGADQLVASGESNEAVNQLDPQVYLEELPRAGTAAWLGEISFYNHIAYRHRDDGALVAGVCQYSSSTKRDMNSMVDHVTVSELSIELWRGGAADTTPTGEADRGQKFAGRGLFPAWPVFGSWAAKRVSKIRNYADLSPTCVRWFKERYPNAEVSGVPGRLSAPEIRPVKQASQFPRWIDPIVNRS